MVRLAWLDSRLKLMKLVDSPRVWCPWFDWVVRVGWVVWVVWADNPDLKRKQRTNIPRKKRKLAYLSEERKNES